MIIGTVRTTLTVDTEMVFTEEDGVVDWDRAHDLAHEQPKKFIQAAVDAYIRKPLDAFVEITDIVVTDVDITQP